MIVLKSKDEIQRIAEACRIAAETLQGIKEKVAPGVTTLELDRFAESYITSRKAVPAFKGYRGYPASLCTSVNEQVVHGIPDSGTKLKNGDIISLDVGVFYNGFYGDSALTLPVGTIRSQTRKLLAVAEEALDRGIETAVVGNRLSDISFAIQHLVESAGFSVVRNFVGHGIGRNLHEEPQIPNFGKKGEGVSLMEGMTLAIEPMVNAGGWEVDILDDGWTAVTRDRSLSAHFEHTVAVTSDGPKTLTKL
ncbi:MAG: type I methionyl aminopeptidase [Candidatus Aenigmarchaeota archaeon]|nr:type I methionyl aminopeptidase [Candidatus Aenigmarchaeota archaeon]